MTSACFKRIVFKFDFGALAFAVFIGSIIFTVYRTAFPGEPPLYNEHGYAIAYRNLESTTVEYDRTFMVRHDFTGTVHRVVECVGQRSYDVPAITRQFTAGSHSTQRTFSMDFKFLPDSECLMRTWVEYQPFGSLRTHTYELKKVQFKVLRGRDD